MTTKTKQSTNRTATTGIATNPSNTVKPSETPTTTINQLLSELFDSQLQAEKVANTNWKQVEELLNTNDFVQTLAEEIEHYASSGILKEKQITKGNDLYFIAEAYLRSASLSSEERKQSANFRAYTALRKGLVRALNNAVPFLDPSLSWSVKSSSKSQTISLTAVAKKEETTNIKQEIAILLAQAKLVDLEIILAMVHGEIEFKRGEGSPRSEHNKRIIEMNKKVDNK